jgi:hypothetical protein
MKKWHLVFIISMILILLAGVYWTAWEDLTTGIPRDRYTGEFKWN